MPDIQLFNILEKYNDFYKVLIVNNLQFVHSLYIVVHFEVVLKIKTLIYRELCERTECTKMYNPLSNFVHFSIFRNCLIFK